MASGTSRGICREVFCGLLDIHRVTWTCVMLSGSHRDRVQVWVEQLLLRGWLWAAEDGGARRLCRLSMEHLWGRVGGEMGA